MARLNKFASVNLNESYGKPDQSGSANASANSSSSGKSRLPTQGGMLVLTRPGRGQSAASKPGRLGIPSPVNLPSLKRETSGGETPVSVSTSPLPGWLKGTQSEILASDSGNLAGATAEKLVSGRSQDNSIEHLKPLSPSPPTSAAIGKPNVYAPPSRRAMQTSSELTPRNPPPPLRADKAAIIRGEEFPTLQASVVRPPTPPQQQRQKEIQHKQREKQLEIKDQQLKLQQLSHQQQANSQKQSLTGSSQAVGGGLQLQPAQPFRPQVKEEQLPKEATLNAKHLGASINQSFGPSSGYGDGTLLRPAPLVRLNHVSGNWTDDEREKGQNLRPQDGHLQVGQETTDIDVRQSGYNNEVELPWSSIHKDSLPSRNGDITKNGRDDYLGESGSSDGSDLRSLSFKRERDFSMSHSAFKDGLLAGFRRGDSYTQQEDSGQEGSGSGSFGRVVGPLREASQSHVQQDGVSKEGSGPGSFRRAVGPVREAVEGREVLHGRESLGREANINRDGREPYNRDPREPYNRDFKETYNRDNRETFNRDARDTREAYNQDLHVSRQVGYGNFYNDGGTFRRSDINDTGFNHSRGSFYAVGGSVSHNPGHDVRHSRRYGFHASGGDHLFSKETRPVSDSRILHGRYVEPSVAQQPPEGFGFRRTRAPTLGVNSYEPESGVYETELERTKNMLEEEHKRKSEDKEMGVKVIREEGSNYRSGKSMHKVGETDGLTARGEQADPGRKFEEEILSWKDEKKQHLSEEERRKEAARRKLLELEQRIARREAEERSKEEVEKGKTEEHLLDDVTNVNAFALSREELGEASLNLEFEKAGKGTLFDRNTGLGWKEEDLSSKMTRPSSASSSSSWTFRGAGEGLSLEQDFGFGVIENKFNQEQRSKSAISWRKEASPNANGPTSKLFSSPYIESGGFHRPSDGGNYKLF